MSADQYLKSLGLSEVDYRELDKPYQSIINSFNTPRQPKVEPSGLTGTLKDAGVTALKGAVGLPQSFVGLADIATGGHVGKALENVGYRPQQAQEYLDTLYSPEQQQANRAVREAQGFLPTLSALKDNPSVIAHTVGESIPSMIGGLGIGKVAQKVLPGLAGTAAGAIGEGAITAGQQAEQIREQSPDRLLDPRQAALSLGSGALTGAVTGGAGRIANRLGIGDINQLGLGQQATGEAGLAKRVLGGAGLEGGQELIQSGQEQAASNIALNQPISEGVGQASALGFVTGAAMGAPGGLIKPQGPLTNAVNQSNINAQDTQSTVNSVQNEEEAISGLGAQNTAVGTGQENLDGLANQTTLNEPNNDQTTDGRTIADVGTARNDVASNVDNASGINASDVAGGLEGVGGSGNDGRINGNAAGLLGGKQDQTGRKNDIPNKRSNEQQPLGFSHEDSLGNVYQATNDPYVFIGQDGNEYVDEKGAITPIDDSYAQQERLAIQADDTPVNDYEDNIPGFDGKTTTQNPIQAIPQNPPKLQAEATQPTQDQGLSVNQQQTDKDSIVNRQYLQEQGVSQPIIDLINSNALKSGKPESYARGLLGTEKSKAIDFGKVFNSKNEKTINKPSAYEVTTQAGLADVHETDFGNNIASEKQAPLGHIGVDSLGVKRTFVEKEENNSFDPEKSKDAAKNIQALIDKSKADGSKEIRFDKFLTPIKTLDLLKSHPELRQVSQGAFKIVKPEDNKKVVKTKTTQGMPTSVTVNKFKTPETAVDEWKSAHGIQLSSSTVGNNAEVLQEPVKESPKTIHVAPEVQRKGRKVSTFNPGKFTIPKGTSIYDKEDKEISGYISGSLAVHKALGKGNKYDISHINTGRRIVGDFPSLSAAKEAATRINAEHDLSGITDKVSLSGYPKLNELVTLVAELRGDKSKKPAPGNVTDVTGKLSPSSTQPKVNQPKPEKLSANAKTKENKDKNQPDSVPKSDEKHGKPATEAKAEPAKPKLEEAKRYLKNKVFHDWENDKIKLRAAKSTLYGALGESEDIDSIVDTLAEQERKAQAEGRSIFDGVEPMPTDKVWQKPKPPRESGNASSMSGLQFDRMSGLAQDKFLNDDKGMGNSKDAGLWGNSVIRAFKNGEFSLDDKGLSADARDLISRLVKDEGLKVELAQSPLATESEYHRQEADNAYQHSNRYGGRVSQDSYVKTINNAYESLNKDLNPEQKAYLDEQFIALKKGYLERDMKVLRTRSGMVSSHIAGKSKFKSSLATRGQSSFDNAVSEMGKWFDGSIAEIKAGILKRRDQAQLEIDNQVASKKAKAKLLGAFLSPLQAMNDPGFDKSAFMGSAKKAWDNLVNESPDYALEIAGKVDEAFKSQGTSLEKVLGTRSNLWKQIKEFKEAKQAEPAQPSQSAEADSAEASGKLEEAKPYTITTHADIMQRLEQGDLSAEDYKAEFERLVSNKEAITAELNGKTKDTLLKEYPWLGARYRNEKKDYIVDAAYRELVKAYHIQPGGISYGFGTSIETAIKNGVEKTTDADLKQYAEDYQKAEAERKAAKEKRQAGMENPQTLEDYTRLLRSWLPDVPTFKDAYMKLTPEQRETYDLLYGEHTRTERKAKADQQKTDVKVAATTTSGDIIETKHTKTGEDLFVVKAAERVERDTYNEWNTTAKRLGGWYSSYRVGGAVPGFQFKTRENAEAFLKYLGGDVTEAKDAVQARRDAYADDKSQSAVERLTEMADRLEEKADEELGRSRKENTAKRAREAASAIASAERSKALAKTMRNIAKAIDSGKAKFLDRVRQKVQVEYLQGLVNTTNKDQIREKYKDSYNDYLKHEHDPATKETADHVAMPTYTLYRSDLAALGRQLLETDGTKKLGQSIMKVADDVSDAYLKFAKDNLHKVMPFYMEGGGKATFSTKQAAEMAIWRSNYRGKAIVLTVKRGENVLILSPSEAIKRGYWDGDKDKKITLNSDVGAEIVEKLGKVNRRKEKVRIPWQFENAYDNRKRLAAMGIENNSELRSAIREFISLQETPKPPSKVKEMERAMVGRRNDGLDFFPTPAHIADSMVETADIKEGMSVLEPSAGMGHIAERIREAGVEPDVVEISPDRRELLEAKGFKVVGSDFNDFQSENGYDRIIMNPPFSDRRDMAHVQHAYDLLKPGGRLVAIMGEGVFFGQDKKATAFRDWLEEVNGTDEKLEEGTFKDPSLPVTTGVNARLVVVDKPEGAKYSKSASVESIESFTERVKNELGLKAFHVFENSSGNIELSNIIVNKADQGKGKGTEALNQLVKYADEQGKTIVLSPGLPNDNHGTTSRARLVKFYKRFGFVESKGRNVDYAIGAGKMYREPNPKFSKYQPGKGSTVAEIRSQLPAYAKRMLADGRLVIDETGKPGVEGYYQNGKIHLVASNINKDTLFSTLHHEIFHYSLATNPNTRQIVDTFNKKMAARFGLALKGVGSKAEIEAAKRVASANTPREDRIEEFQAYLISQYTQPNNTLGAAIRKLISDFIASIKLIMQKLGVPLKELTAADLNALALDGIKSNIQGKLVSSFDNARAMASTKYSIASDVVDNLPDWGKETANKLTQEIQDRFANDKTFNWLERNIATQSYKAWKDKDYKPVFDSSVAYEQSTALLANEAADLAPSLLPKLEGLKESIAEIRKGKKRTDDAEKIGRAIMDTTLQEKPMTDAELEKAGYTPEQITMYHEFYAAVNKSLDDAALSEMMRLAKSQDMKLAPSGMSIQDAAKFYADQSQKPEDKAVFIDKASVIQELKDKGYAPLSRYGQYTVAVYEGDSKTPIYFGMHESLKEANKEARQMRDLYPEANVKQGILSQNDWQLFRGVTPETMQVFAKMMGIDQDKAFQEYYKLALSNQSAMKKLIHRKKIEGYSLDTQRILSTFITSNARHSAKNMHMGDMLNAIADIPKEKGDIRDEAVSLYDYVQNPNTAGSGARNVLFAYYLGGSIAAAGVNLTQTLTTTYPALHRLGSAKDVASILPKAMKMAANPKMIAGELAKALKRAEEEGVTAPHELHMLYQESMRTGFTNVTKQLRPFAKFWGSFFSLAEAYNRRVAFISAYTMAKGTPEQKFSEAEKMVLDTQFQYSKSARSSAARSALGSTIFTFKTFTINYIEFLKKLPMKERAIALGVLMLMAGASGLPGADDADDIIDTIGQSMGYNVNSKAWKDRYINHFLLYGLSSILPIDISSRLGVGNLIPGSAIFKRSETDKSRDVMEFIGPMGSLAKNAIEAYDVAASREGVFPKLTAMKDVILPKAISDMVKAYDMASDGVYKDFRGYKVVETTPLDAVAKLVGFQPEKVAEARRPERFFKQYKELAVKTESEIAELWAKGIYEKDQDKIKEAKSLLTDWNVKNPDTPIRINQSQLMRRVKEMRNTSSGRLLKHAPKELRGFGAGLLN